MTTLGVVFETLIVQNEGPVLSVDISAPPVNLLGPELVRDLVSLIERAEARDDIAVLVFKSANPEYFISHVDITGRSGVPRARSSHKLETKTDSHEIPW
jgi:enoyl-CoA hydratase/carnithine racemase